MMLIKAVNKTLQANRSEFFRADEIIVISFMIRIISKNKQLIMNYLVNCYHNLTNRNPHTSGIFAEPTNVGG